MNGIYTTNKICQSSSRLCSFNIFHKVRLISTLKPATAVLEEDVHESIANNERKPKKHPGIIHHGPYSLPPNIKKSISTLLNGPHKKQLFDESKGFKNFLFARQTPVEKNNLLNKRRNIAAEVEQTLNIQTELLTEDELKRYNELKNVKIKHLLKQRVYSWSRLNFTDYLGLLYLVTRTDAEYAAISHVFTEISTRSSFEPKTLFDFGSGIGSVVWAAKDVWRNSISEYYCVDSSSSMIELSEKIIKKAYDTKFLQQIFHRQFLPSSSDISSDLVVSAYSLLELPSRSTRLEVIKNLWSRTQKYLVLIEFGTQAGFQVLNEARDYILSEEFNEDRGHVFAPCPHDLSCPRSLSGKHICYFPAPYMCFPQKPEVLNTEMFTFVVFEKGPRKAGINSWPRIVQPVLKRSRHAICRFCTSSGDLKEVIFTPTKHGKVTYKCARSSRWGDLFPCTIDEKRNKKEHEEQESS